MASKITNYQCPACTGPLHYSAGSGRLECEYCGSAFDVAEIEALYAKKEAAAAEALEKESAEAPAEQAVTEADQADSGDDVPEAGDFSTDWGEDTSKMRSYLCPSCGAELICEETTAATACPYCGNPTVVPGKFAGVLRPDYVIPFKFDKAAAEKALKAHYGRNPFLPRAFTADNHIAEIKGVYVPFWLFDVTATGDAFYHATRIATHISGDYEVTTTSHYDVSRGGTASFTRVPADGSQKMPDDYMDSLEPFDYSELKPFSTAYLPGYLADQYDVDAKSCAQRVDKRCRQSVSDLLRQDVMGYATVVQRSMRAKIQHGDVRYALLPVWLLNTRWNGKNYLYAMNGQTGKFVGELPVSRKRFWALTGLFTAALTALFYFSGIARALVSLFV